MAKKSKRSIDLMPLDYSKEALSRAVKKTAIENPLVTWSTAIGGVGVLSASVLGTSWLFAIPLIVAAGAFSLNYFGRRDAIALSYMLSYSIASCEQAEILAVYLRGEFAELDYERGAHQIEMLQKHLETIAHMLGERFDVNDISYQQFMGPAEILYIQTLNLLKDAAIQLRANQTFDKDYDGKMKRGAAEDSNAAKRKELYEGGVQRFNALMASVESAITGLAELTHDVARIGSESHTHDDYIQRVREVASRANLYEDQKRI